MKTKFRTLDTSGDGLLDFDELCTLLRKGNSRMTDRQVKVLYGRIDTDHDGKINFDEFVDYIFASELDQARSRVNKRSRTAKSVIKQWEGTQQLRINGSWDRETKRAFQQFLLAQQTETARTAPEQKFVTGSIGTSNIVVLQEVLLQHRMPTALANRSTTQWGLWDDNTTKALHELLLAEGAPTAERCRDHFLHEPFGKLTVTALQELLIMLRRSRGPGLGMLQ